jgi:uncharacterized protein YkwD
MMKFRSAVAISRALAAAALLSVSALTAPAVSYAAPDLTHLAKKGQIAKQPAAAPSGDFLGQLLAEINARREMVGTPPVAYIADEANAAVSDYLADLTPQMEAYNSCFHGQNNPIAPGWDYVAASGIEGEARGEVLACPDDNGFWTSDRIADAWMNSPAHFQELYADFDANAVACGTYGSQRGGRAFETIACVTYHI